MKKRSKQGKPVFKVKGVAGLQSNGHHSGKNGQGTQPDAQATNDTADCYSVMPYSCGTLTHLE